MFDSADEINKIAHRMKLAGIEDKEIEELLLPLKKELERRVCGLVWQHKESSIPPMKACLPAFVRKDERCILRGNGNSNILIEGDNIFALMGLQYTHIDEQGKGLIDVIYIDPPYNIDASGVAYNDKFERSEWISIMDIRLRLARNLLADDGIILISIDDKFVSELRMLCSDIFGGDGTTFMIESSVIAGPRRVPAMQGSVVKTAEYVLAYRKDNETKIIRNLMYDYIRGFDTHYSKIAVNNDICDFIKVIKNTRSIAGEFEKHNVKISLKNMSQMIELSDKVREWLYSDEIADNLFRVGDKENLDDENTNYPNNKLFKVENKWYVKNDAGAIHNVFRYKDRIGKCDDYFSSFGERQVRGNLWKGFSSDGGNLDKEGGVSFKSGKKPVRLIKQLLWSMGKDNALVLDFFAGSGTTGQAVLELNDYDQGSRRFILCTNNEVGKEAAEKAKKNGVIKGSLEWEEYGVCRAITHKRMQNIYANRNDNLYYYQIDCDLSESETEEDTIKEVLKKFVSYVSIKETAFILKNDDSWSILKDDFGKEIMVVTNPDISLRDVMKAAKSTLCVDNKKIYCKTEKRMVDGEYELIPYPKEIMKVLRSRRKDIIRGELR